MKEYDCKSIIYCKGTKSLGKCADRMEQKSKKLNLRFETHLNSFLQDYHGV